MNETYYLKTTGKANIPEPMKIGEGYKVILDGEIVSETRQNKEHNGELDVTFLFKPALASVEDQYGKIIRAKDLQSYSARVRRALYRISETDTDSLDFEADYERTMQWLLTNLGDVYEKAKAS